MENHELKIQHLIILSALFITLLGSLLLLDQINEKTEFAGATTATVVEDHGYSYQEAEDDTSHVRIVTKTNLSDS